MKKVKIILASFIFATLASVIFGAGSIFSAKNLGVSSSATETINEDLSENQANSQQSTLDSSEQTKTVTFIDGESETTETFVVGEGIEKLSAPTERYGYDFVGWFSEPNGEGVQYESISAEQTDDITLYSYFTLHEYTITYYSDMTYTLNRNPTTYTIETEAFDLISLTSTSLLYKFAGWYDSEDFTIQVTSINPESLYENHKLGDIELYAKWETRTYNVTIYSNSTFGQLYVNDTSYEGSVTLSIEYNTSVSYLDNILIIGDYTIKAVANSNYATFDGWENVPTTITSTTTINAIFSEIQNSYTITFSSNLQCYISNGGDWELIGSNNSFNILASENWQVKLEIVSIYEHYHIKTLTKNGENILEYDEFGNYITTYIFDFTGNLNFVYEQELDSYSITFSTNNALFGTLKYNDLTGERLSININYGSKIIYSEGALLVYNAIDTDGAFEDPVEVVCIPQTSDFEYSYSLLNWTGEEISFLDENYEGFEFIANFTQTLNSYTISFDSLFIEVRTKANEIVSSGDSLPYGTILTVICTPSEHHHIKAITLKDNNQNQSGTTIQNNSSFVLSGTTEILFEQEIDTHTITFDDNIVVLVNGNQIFSGESVDYATEITITYKTFNYKYIVSLTKNGEEILFDEGNEIKQSITVRVEEDLVLISTYMLETYTVEFISNNEQYGTLNQTSITVTYGSKIYLNSDDSLKIEVVDENGEVLNIIYIEATPNSGDLQTGYRIASWSVSGNLESEIYVVDGDCIVTANFESYTKEYEITFDDNVSVLVDYIPISSGDYLTYGTSIVVVANCDEGYEVGELYYKISETNSTTTINSNESIIVGGTTEIVLIQNLIDYTISVSDMQNGSVIVASTANLNDIVEVTVLPDKLYALEELYYMIGEEKITITNLSFSMPNSNITIYATFKLSYFEVQDSVYDLFVMVDLTDKGENLESDFSTTTSELSQDEISALSSQIESENILIALNISLNLNENEFTPTKEIKIEIGLGSITNADNIKVYAISETGEVSEVYCRVVYESESPYVLITAQSTGKFVISQTIQSASEDNGGSSLENIIQTYKIQIIIMASIIGVVIIVTVVYAIIKLRRKF